MRKVVISYSPNSRDVGKEREVDDETAATMVREGRARYADDSAADKDGTGDQADQDKPAARKTTSSTSTTKTAGKE